MFEAFNFRQLTRIIVVAFLLLQTLLLEVRFFLEKDNLGWGWASLSITITIALFYFVYREVRKLPDPRIEEFEEKQKRPKLTEDLIAENRDSLRPKSDFAEAVLNRLSGEFEALYPCLKEAIALAALEHRRGEHLSKIGGKPSLPKGFEWPIYHRKIYQENEPEEEKILLQENVGALPFVAQICLEELPNIEQIDVLPNKGMLYFFADFLDHKISTKPEAVKVCYIDDEQGPFFETDLPENILPGIELYGSGDVQTGEDWDKAFPERWFHFVPVLRLYQYDDLEKFMERAVGASEIPSHDACRKFEQQLFRASLDVSADPANFKNIEKAVIYHQEMSEIEADFESVRHQILGFPDSVHGGYLFSNNYERDAFSEEAHPYLPILSETVLLLQLDSDIYCDFTQFGEEMGLLQFHIALQDLKDGAFEKARLHLDG